jgi:hypothetical protein
VAARSDAQPEAAEAVSPPRGADAAVLSALEFLDFCVAPSFLVDSVSRPAARTGEITAGSATAARYAPAPPSRAVPAAKTSVPDPARARPRSVRVAWRVPPGLLYWLTVAAATAITWRLGSSFYRVAVAALAASAAVIVIELILRAIDPRIARRLGLASASTSTAFYGVAVLLGLGTGVAVGYIL